MQEFHARLKKLTEGLPITTPDKARDRFFFAAALIPIWFKEEIYLAAPSWLDPFILPGFIILVILLIGRPFDRQSS